MTDYKILEVTTSYREDIVPNSNAGDTTSVINCYLVAHCLFEYGLNNEIGTVDADIYKIATKTYDSDGNFELEAGTGEIPTYEDVEELLKAIIEDKIKSDYNEITYKSLIRRATGIAEEIIDKSFRDSQPGLSLFDK